MPTPRRQTLSKLLDAQLIEKLHYLQGVEDTLRKFVEARESIGPETLVALMRSAGNERMAYMGEQLRRMGGDKPKKTPLERAIERAPKEEATAAPAAAGEAAAEAPADTGPEETIF